MKFTREESSVHSASHCRLASLTLPGVRGDCRTSQSLWSFDERGLDDCTGELNIAAECVSKLDAGNVNQPATNSSRRLASISRRLERRRLSDIEHVTT